MSQNTHIQWTDHTWPITTGCEKISPGCRGCYAISHSWRLAHNPNAKVAAAYAGTVRKVGDEKDGTNEKTSLNWTGLVRFLPERLDWPGQWKKPAKIFVGNMSDIFHDGIGDEDLHQIFDSIDSNCRHTFQILTKRTDRMADFLDSRYRSGIPEYIWPGTSVENQGMAVERLPLLMMLRAPVKFVSYEPALGPVNWSEFSAKKGFQQIIVGGESETPGCPPARGFDLAWARQVINFCDLHGIAPFVKQLGARPYEAPETNGGTGFFLTLENLKGGDLLEWPEQLRRREFPRMNTN